MAALARRMAGSTRRWEYRARTSSVCKAHRKCVALVRAAYY